jgi:hypothetical protein
MERIADHRLKVKVSFVKVHKLGWVSVRRTQTSAPNAPGSAPPTGNLPPGYRSTAI